MKIYRDFPMNSVLWYKIGGTTRYYIECETIQDVHDAFVFVQREKLSRYFVTGIGANLLFTDEYFDGAVIMIKTATSVQGQAPNSRTTPHTQERGKNGNGDGIYLSGKDTVTAFAGELLDSVIQFAFDHNLTGLEWAGGLPGTVGAAVRGNVGAFGGEIKDTFGGAEILRIDKRGSAQVYVTRRDIKFAYRASTVKTHKNLIVLSASFKLKTATDAEVAAARRTYFANIEYRKLRHPLEFPNTGSVFKNITRPQEVAAVLDVFPDIKNRVEIDWHGKVSVGYLIKRLDLSGFRVGNAEISQKHSNFIINLGGATFLDVFTIIQKVKQTFEDMFGFSPEVEVEIVE